MGGETDTSERATPGVFDDLDDAANILVLAPNFGGAKPDVCRRLIGGTSDANQHALVVTYNESADSVVTQIRDTMPAPPRQLAVIAVGETTRGETYPDSTASRPPVVDGEPTVDAIQNPGDLTGLGIKLAEYFKDFDTDRWDGGPSDLVFCFDSITTLLQYASVEEVFRFLHVLTQRLQSIGATAHYHLIPDAHDEQTLATLGALFDAQLDASAGPDPADWTVDRV